MRFITEKINTPTEKQEANLISDGFMFNLEMYKLSGELLQMGSVGSITSDYFTVGRLRLKTGENWYELLDDKNFNVKILSQSQFMNLK